MEMRFAFLKLEGTQPKQIQKSSLDQALKNRPKKSSNIKTKTFYLFPIQIEGSFDFPEETAS